MCGPSFVEFGETKFGLQACLVGSRGTRVDRPYLDYRVKMSLAFGEKYEHCTPTSVMAFLIVSILGYFDSCFAHQ